VINCKKYEGNAEDKITIYGKLIKTFVKFIIQKYLDLICNK